MAAADTTQLLKQAWHEETAANSIERWVRFSEQQRWQGKPENQELLIRIFGASWYFTRFIFANGRQAIEIIDQNRQAVPDKEWILSRLQPSLADDDVEIRANHLRVLKNGLMLQFLAGWLQQWYTLKQLECLLTLLAEATLEVLIQSLRRLPQYEQFPVSILAMGRMAGYEMTFGSDLDLIFLYDEKHQDMYNDMGRTIRLLLRTIAQPAAAGSLYDVDMRLRPHGNSGLLITSFNSFIEYHNGDRDVWERQMMTRCRPILKSGGKVDSVLEHVNQNVYRQYDQKRLCGEVLAMRIRVQKELGSPRDKYDIKRGYGGIMDIDFISHYLQLAWGHKYDALQTASTRQALAALGDVKLVDMDTVASLTTSYDYLKKLEMCLRLFDMKSIDSFRTVESADNRALSRAMGHGDNIRQFLEEYVAVTRSVRRHFEQLLV